MVGRISSSLPSVLSWVSFSFIPIFGLVLPISVRLRRSPVAYLSPEPALYPNLSLYVAVLVINDSNESRIEAHFRSWGRDFHFLSPSSIYRVASFHRLRSVPVRMLSSPRKRHRRIQSYLDLFEDHLHYFLRRTTLRWFLRTTEDAFIDLIRLPGLVRDLERAHDPTRDIVMMGQACAIGPSVTFLHGGSGWIMSRAAAALYEAHERQIHAEFFGPTVVGDDMVGNIFRVIANLSDERIDHPAFLGSPVVDESISRLERMEISNLTVCPSIERQRREQRLARPVKDIVVWHSGRSDLLPLRMGYRILRECPDGIQLAHVRGGVKLCRIGSGGDNADASLWDEA
jgi:hypothetical protein